VEEVGFILENDVFCSSLGLFVCVQRVIGPLFGVKYDFRIVVGSFSFG
jgi:hypothetical protein